MIRRSLSSLLFGLTVIAGELFLLWLRFHQPPNIVDDAYITFRYARNLVTGLGFVYNVGEQVLGTTAPAYALLLAGLSWISGFYDYPRLAVMVNALCNAITFAVLIRLAARLTGQRWIGLGVALLFAMDGRVLDWSTGGMETSFNLLVIVLTLALFFENRRAWAALTTGLAVLIRPDGATLTMAIFLGWALPAVFKPRQWPWKELLIVLAVTVPWFTFATLFYGTPIPQSVLAKAVVYRLDALQAFRAFLVQLRTVFSFSLPPLQDGQSLARQIAQALFPAGLCLLGLVALTKRHPRAWVSGVYLALFIALFSVGNPLWLGWYETPLMPLYQLLILSAGYLPLAMRRDHLPREAATRLAVPILAFGLMALPQLSRLNLLPWEKPQHAAFVLNPTFNKRREADYQLIAAMLRPAAEHDRLVAIPEIGAFGYIYPGRLFDTTGLISPAIHPYFPIPKDIPIEIYSVPRQLLFDLKPDLFVSFDGFIQATLPLDDPEFLELYRPTIGLTSHAAFGLQRLMTYRRHDLPIEVTLPPEATLVSARFGPDELTLHGYIVTTTRDPDNQFVDVILFWQGPDVETGIDRDLLVRARLLDANGNLVYEILNQPGETLFPTPTWRPGFWLVDRYPLKRPTPDSKTYTITITVFASDADDSLLALAADGTPLPDNTLTIPVGDIQAYAVTP